MQSCTMVLSKSSKFWVIIWEYFEEDLRKLKNIGYNSKKSLKVLTKFEEVLFKYLFTK